MKEFIKSLLGADARCLYWVTFRNFIHGLSRSAYEPRAQEEERAEAAKANE